LLSIYIMYCFTKGKGVFGGYFEGVVAQATRSAIKHTRALLRH